MAYYAKQSFNIKYKDVLIIDNAPKKEALVGLIKNVASIHKWNQVLDLSVKIDNVTNFKPNLRKRIIREIKHWHIIKSIYTILLKQHESDKIKRQHEILKNKLNLINAISINNDDVELFLLTQTSINNSLHAMFSKAEVYYMEHGLGDYLYFKNMSKKDGALFIFSDSYSQFIKNTPLATLSIKGYINSEGFDEVFSIYSNEIGDKLQKKASTNTKKWVLFLMDAAEIYLPPKHFWTDYIDKCLNEIEDLAAYTIIVKPHPLQSNDVLEITRNYFQSKNIDFILLDSSEFISLSAETIYVRNKHRIGYVFSTFSSALFYLAHFYGDKTKFYHLYHFVEPYLLKNAPKQYVYAFKELGPLIDKVFSNKNCIALK